MNAPYVNAYDFHLPGLRRGTMNVFAMAEDTAGEERFATTSATNTLGDPPALPEDAY
jgi:hypothetical protein